MATLACLVLLSVSPPSAAFHDSPEIPDSLVVFASEGKGDIHGLLLHRQRFLADSPHATIWVPENATGLTLTLETTGYNQATGDPSEIATLSGCLNGGCVWLVQLQDFGLPLKHGDVTRLSYSFVITGAQNFTVEAIVPLAAIQFFAKPSFGGIPTLTGGETPLVLKGVNANYTLFATPPAPHWPAARGSHYVIGFEAPPHDGIGLAGLGWFGVGFVGGSLAVGASWLVSRRSQSGRADKSRAIAASSALDRA